MQDSVAYESYPTHPLGVRESWPATGPIYDVPEPEIQAEPPRTIWQRLMANVSQVPENMGKLPANSPIWY